MRLRILHILGRRRLAADPERAGASGVVLSTLELAREQAKLGHDVWVASVGDSAWRSSWEGVTLTQLHARPWAKISLGRGRSMDISKMLPLIALTRGRHFNVLHGQMFSYMRFLRGDIRVIHFRSDPFHQGTGSRNDRTSERAFDLIATTSDAQIAISRFVARQLSKGLAGRGRVFTVHNAVDLDRFDPDRNRSAGREFRTQLGLDGQHTLYLYAGALVPEKGVLHLAKAFVALTQQLPSARLALAGSSDLWGSALDEDAHQGYEQAVRQALGSVRDKVHFLGKVSIEMMPRVYAACDVAVIPSVWQEAFGRVAVEALASGKPVIASDTGGLPEIVSHSNGLLVTPANEADLEAAMLTIGKDEDVYRLRQNEARNSVARFNLQRLVEDIELVYHEVLAERR